MQGNFVDEALNGSNANASACLLVSRLLILSHYAASAAVKFTVDVADGEILVTSGETVNRVDDFIS